MLVGLLVLEGFWGFCSFLIWVFSSLISEGFFFVGWGLGGGFVGRTWGAYWFWGVYLIVTCLGCLLRPVALISLVLWGVFGGIVVV